MSKALSLDLRVRVLAVVEAGASHREAGNRFGVSAASVSRWRRLAREQGEPRPGPLGGDRRSQRIEAHAAAIRALVDSKPDITLSEIKAGLAEQGVEVGIGTLWRFFRRHGMTLKNVWPAPSARLISDGVLVCINVSGLRREPGQDGIRAFQAS
jgi:transposase